MKLFSILLIVISLNTFGQLTNECFDNAIYQRNTEMAQSSELNVGDSANQILNSMQVALKKIIGCRLPYSSFLTSDGKELNYDKIKSDYIIINFNYIFCDFCINQLDSIASIKKVSKKSITIVSFFSCKKSEIQNLIDKYKDLVIFVPNSENYIKYFGLNCGQPLNYILDNTKTIIYANRNLSQKLNSYLVN